MTVFKSEIWWGDDWDPLDYGQDPDFSKPFFEQLANLIKKTPHPNLIAINAQNSAYTNYNLDNVNSYMSFAGNYLQDGYYCYNAEKCKDCCDCLFTWDCENCYECTNCTNCYNVKFGLHSTNCSDSAFIEDCRNCKNCFLCFGLNYKEYCILNKPYSPEDYHQKLEQMKIHTKEGQDTAFKLWREQSKNFETRADQNYQCENCEGDYMHQCKNCQKCYIMSKECEDCKYIFNGFPALKDSMDCLYAGDHAELVYECIATGERGSNLKFSHIAVTGTYDAIYCDLVINCKNVFGCTALRNKEYCILNKQYTKDQYEELVPKIIEHMKSTGEWGQFMDPKYSPFGYNETTAQIYFSLSKEEALRQGFNWRDGEDIQAKEAHGDNVKICEATGKPFKLVAQELKFYQRNNIPEPSKCFEARHKARMALRHPLPNWN